MSKHNQKRDIQELLGLAPSDSSDPMAQHEAKPQFQPEYKKSKPFDVSKLSTPKTKPKYITVYDLDKELHGEFRKNDLFNNFYITGGVSGIKKYRWAWYFTLDDPKHSKVSMSAELPSYVIKKLPFNFENGMRVDIVASLTMSRRYGNAQIKVRKILPAGISDLYLRTQKTKRELAKAGYFNKDHKKAIPMFSKRVAVITSSKGAVVRDIIDTIRLRCPKVQVVLFPTAVSGERAKHDLIKSVHHVDEVGNFDSAIIGRGGGSKKDLQVFNDKDLAIAIYNCKTPIISSVGHGIDNEFISNYVADMHADTPTAAADMVVPVTMHDVFSYLHQWHQMDLSAIKSKLKDYKSKLSDLSQTPVYQHPLKMYEPYYQDLQILHDKLHERIDHILTSHQQKLYSLSETVIKHDPMSLAQDQIAKIKLLRQKLDSNMNQYLQNRKSSLIQLDSNVKQASPRPMLNLYKSRLDMLCQQLQANINSTVQHHVDQLRRTISIIKQLNPKLIMKRGASFVTKHGHTINDASKLNDGDQALLQLYKGKLLIKVLKHK